MIETCTNCHTPAEITDGLCENCATRLNKGGKPARVSNSKKTAATKKVAVKTDSKKTK